jgi:hypothetical protein
MGLLTAQWTVLNVTGPGATAGLFATYPTEHMTIGGRVVDQVSYFKAILPVVRWVFK